MSYFTQTKIAAPATPAAGKAVSYVDTAGVSHVLDATGVDNAIGNNDKVNVLRNSGFWFAQRQAPATLTTYSSVGGRAISADGWGISNENASTQYRRVDTSGAVETGLQSQFYGELTKITATGKIQFSQVIETKDIASMRGRPVRLQAKLKAVIGTPVTLKMAVLQLSSAGAVDTVPSGAGLFLTASGANGVDPTLGSNLAWLAPKAGVTPDNATAATNNVTCSATTTWQRFGMVVDVPATAKNLVVMIWTDNQVIATNGFAISEVSLTDGFEIQAWSPLSYDSELSRVRRYYAKSFNVDTLPAQNAGLAGAVRGHVSVAGAIASQPIGIRFPMPMRVAPTCVFFNPSVANAFARNTTAATDATATAASTPAEAGTDAFFTGLAAWTVAQAVAVHYTADAEL